VAQAFADDEYENRHKLTVEVGFDEGVKIKVFVTRALGRLHRIFRGVRDAHRLHGRSCRAGDVAVSALHYLYALFRPVAIRGFSDPRRVVDAVGHQVLHDRLRPKGKLEFGRRSAICARYSALAAFLDPARQLEAGALDGLEPRPRSGPA
jgi:hypothetical protein